MRLEQDKERRNNVGGELLEYESQRIRWRKEYINCHVAI
tara:strand:- start:445 stop:561 length:117 start_codon:yes stop_codon:yes gene_type:complete